MSTSERHSELKVVRWTDRINGILSGVSCGPIRANLDLTNLCSHKCLWCEPLEFRLQTIADREHTLTTRIALETVSQLRDMGCQSIVFSGGGEPTLHPEFGEILEDARSGGAFKRPMRTSVVTHGGFIEKWLHSLSNYADHVRVSLDASNQEEHARVHQSRNGEFDRILAGICALRSCAKRPEIGLAYVVTPGITDSVSSLYRAVDLADSLSVDYLHFRPASLAGKEFTAEAWGKVVVVIEHLRKTAKTPLLAMGKRLTDVFTQREFSKCYAALTLATISANGDVSACCDERQIVFGNLYRQPFSSIWLSELHRSKADSITPKLCARCLNCGYNRAVERYVVNNEAFVEVI